MPYEIAYALKGKRNVSVTQASTAQSALVTVRALQASDEEIRSIKVPAGHESRSPSCNL